MLPGVVSHSAHAEPRSIYAGRQLWGLQNPYYRGLLCGAADEGRAVTCSFKICYKHVALVTLRVVESLAVAAVDRLVCCANR